MTDERDDTKLTVGEITDRRDIPITRIGSDGNFRGDLGNIDALAKSLETLGQRQAIEVTVDESKDPPFRVVDGHRRLAAAEKLGWQSINANVVRYGNTYSRDVASFSANMARDDLSTYEIAAAMYHFCAEYKLSGNALSKRMGELFEGTRRPYTRQHINNLRRAYENATPELREYWKEKAHLLSLNSDIFPVSAKSAQEQISWVAHHTMHNRGPDGDKKPGSEGGQKPKKASELHVKAALNSLRDMVKSNRLSEGVVKDISCALLFCLGTKRKLIVGGKLVYDMNQPAVGKSKAKAGKQKASKKKASSKKNAPAERKSSNASKKTAKKTAE